MAIVYEDRFGFDRMLDTFDKKVRRAALLRIRRLARSLHDRVINNTPVKTGTARANWNLSINTPNFEVVDHSKSPISAAQAGANARQSQKLLQNFTLAEEHKIYITNGVYYIGLLEHGDATRKAHAMMEMAQMAVTSLADTGGDE